MSKRGWQILFQDMLESIYKIEQYTADLNYDEFSSSPMTMDAVVRNLEIIGEASNRLPDDVKERYEKIPWRQVIGLRHRIVHAYFSIDVRIVWTIIQQDLSVLKETLEEGLASGTS